MRVKKVKYLDGYRLELLFSDEKIKIVDLSDLIKEGGYYFEPLKDVDFFKKVSLDDKKNPLSICWPNEADICPNVLYEMGQEVSGQKKSPDKRVAIKKKTFASTVASRKISKRISSKIVLK